MNEIPNIFYYYADLAQAGLVRYIWRMEMHMRRRAAKLQRKLLEEKRDVHSRSENR